MKLSINPEYEKLVPRPSREEYIALKESIKDSGQRQAIIVNKDGIVLDGHTRFKACTELNVSPKYEVVEFKNEVEEKIYVIEVNLQRRNLTSEQKLALGLKLEPLIAEQAEKRLHLAKGQGIESFKVASPDATLSKTSTIVAQKVGLSERTFERGKAVIERAPTKLKNEMLSGKIEISRAYRELRSKEVAKELIEKYKDVKVAAHIERADFRNVKVAQNSVDAIITDPPYPKEFLPLYTDLADYALEVLKPGGSLVCLNGTAYLPEIFERLSKKLTYRWTIAYILLGQKGPARGSDLLVQSQYWKSVLWFTKPPVRRTAIVKDLIESERPEKSGVVKMSSKWGDMQQSVTGFEQLIELFSKVGDTILDPLMGSGTTGVSAIKLKRNFIGIEFDKETFDYAKARISEAEQ